MALELLPTRQSVGQADKKMTAEELAEDAKEDEVDALIEKAASVVAESLEKENGKIVSHVTIVLNQRVHGQKFTDMLLGKNVTDEEVRQGIEDLLQQSKILAGILLPFIEIIRSRQGQRLS